MELNSQAHGVISAVKITRKKLK